MEEFMEITYLDGFSNHFKIMDPVSKIIKVLIVSKKYIKNIKDIEEFNKENAIYFLVEEAKKSVSLEFLINNNKEKEEDLNNIYKTFYKNNIPKLYIGETTSTQTRYNCHHIKHYDYAVIFISKLKEGFSEDEILYMEKYYYMKYKDSIYCDIKNNNKPKGAELNKRQSFIIKNYIKQIDELLYIINRQIFNIQLKLYEINQKGIKARAYIMEDKLTIVIKESEAVKDITASSKEKSLDKKRSNLIDKSILNLKGDKYKFTQDYIFGTRSGAAECILGTSRSGKEAWKEIRF